MAMTSEERSKLPLCGAQKKDGTYCRAFQGQGTQHPGVGFCKYHGGATPNGNKHALKLETQQRMIAMSEPVADVEPHEILLTELSYSAGHVSFLRSEITELANDEIGSERAKVLLSRYDDERERLTRIAKTCSDAGVDEALVRIETVKAASMVRAINIAAQEAGIPKDYVNALGVALRKQVALMAGDQQTAAAEEARVQEIRTKISATEQQRAEKRAQKLAGLVPADEMVIDGRARETR